MKSKKRSRKPTHYWCDMWRVNYYYFIGWPAEEFSKYMKKAFDHDASDAHKSGGRAVLLDYENGDCIICIWVPGKDDFSALAHECLHATNFTMRRAGCLPDLDNDEPQAYLLENIYQQALSA